MSSAEKLSVEDLLDALARADVLETFSRLRPEDQQKFSRWVGKARNTASHWQRINALVLAMRIGPLEPVRPRVSGFDPREEARKILIEAPAEEEDPAQAQSSRVSQDL